MKKGMKSILFLTLFVLAASFVFSFSHIFSENSFGIFDQTEGTDLGVRLEVNTSAWSLYDGDRIDPYLYDSGDFKSLVFYNSTSTYWNTNLSLADSDGTWTTYDLCNNDVNCVSYWSLDTYGDGNPYNDKKGSNHGTPTGTNNATGISSGAVRFDDTPDRIEINEIGDSLESDYGVISMWVNLNEFNTAHELFSKTNPYENTDDYIKMQIENSQSIRFFAQGGKSIIKWNLDETLIEGKWYNLIMGYNETGNYTLYVNGIIQTNQEEEFGFGGTKATEWLSKEVTNKTWFLGYWNRNISERSMRGLIDEVLIYNDTLTLSEIEQLYKAGLSQHANTNITLQTRTADSYNVSDAGLVSHWSMQDRSGTKVIDLTGRNNGTAVGGVSFGEDYGVVGEGGNFNGDYIEMENQDNFNFGTDNFAVSFWYKTSDDRNFPLGKGAYHLDGAGWSTYISSSGYLGIVFDDGTGNRINTNTQIDTTDGQWHHFVGVRNSGTGEVYHDGNLAFNQSDPTGNIDNTNPFVIGNYEVKTISGFVGSIDEVRIYNRSLSADEIQDLYELGKTHIEWNDWQDEGKAEDDVGKVSTDKGKFMQFKTIFNTDTTSVSPYLTGYSILNQEEGGSAAGCIDNDNDGFGAEGSNHSLCNFTQVDCDDSNANIYPGATEIKGNGIDEDCDGEDATYVYFLNPYFIDHSEFSTFYVGDYIRYRINITRDDLQYDPGDIVINLTDHTGYVLASHDIDDMERLSEGFYEGEFTTYGFNPHTMPQSGIRLEARAYDDVGTELKLGLHQDNNFPSGTPPSITSSNFSFSTNAESNFTVENLYVGNELSSINWSNSRLDLSQRPIDLDSAINLGYGFVSVDSSNWPELVTSRVTPLRPRVSVQVDGCDTWTIYHSSQTTTSFDDLISNGVVVGSSETGCNTILSGDTEEYCSNVVCDYVSGTLSYDVLHFDSTGGEGNAGNPEVIPEFSTIGIILAVMIIGIFSMFIWKKKD
jgi:hypothetical protein